VALRIVVEREEDIDRAGADRQRRHQAADQRAGALGRHRRRQHEAGGDGHFDDEREREIKVGGHFSDSGPGRVGTRGSYTRASFTSTGGPFLMV